MLFTSLSLNPLELYYAQISFLITFPLFYLWYVKPSRSRSAYVIWALMICHWLILSYWHWFQRGGEWRTQTIVYQNMQNRNRTIEFQMQDIGALGYNRRHIDRTKIFSFLEMIRKLTLIQGIHYLGRRLIFT
ncbi:MAG: hypothetical protein AAGA02_15625 [Bacteroidota bacterium]